MYIHNINKLDPLSKELLSKEYDLYSELTLAEEQQDVSRETLIEMRKNWASFYKALIRVINPEAVVDYHIHRDLSKLEWYAEYTVKVYE